MSATRRRIVIQSRTTDRDEVDEVGNTEWKVMQIVGVLLLSVPTPNRVCPCTGPGGGTSLGADKLKSVTGNWIRTR